MSVSKLILLYSFRLLRREWRKFVLPFVSLFITAVVLILILLLTAGSSLLLEEQARELQGGDVVLESNLPIKGEDLFAEVGLLPDTVSAQVSFSATLQSSLDTAPFSVQAVDGNYPLYGNYVLQSGQFDGVQAGEIYLDRSGAEKLMVTVGDQVTFGNLSLNVAGVIVSEPTSLFGGFRFLPKALMSAEDFLVSGIDPTLLRAEYVYATKFNNSLSVTEKTRVKLLEDKYKEVDVDIAGQDRRGLQFGLELVSNFLIVAVLVTAVLATVNIYASTLYLVTTERKSLAVLLALGLGRKQLIGVLGLTLLYLVLGAGVIGVMSGGLIFSVVNSYIAENYLLVLPLPDFAFYAGVTVVLLTTVALSSFTPAVRQLLSFNPKQILIGGEGEKGSSLSLSTVTKITVATLLPLIALSYFLLSDLLKGLLVVGSIILVYVGIAGLFAWLLSLVYQRRKRFGFFIRSIISQKKADGLFGIVSFTSLFVALTALGTLALMQKSLESYLVGDLAQTVPSTYVLDIQPSQKAKVLEAFPELELFANISARLVAIDDLKIQEELEKGSDTVDRELGREFNLTARDYLLSSERVLSGSSLIGQKGEISVDAEFAKRANIELGSKLVFSIQGFEVSGVVTSLRESDSRSGLPFFYFVLSKEDLGDFPSVYFGYSYYEAEKQKELGRFLAKQMPNVSVIETGEIGPLLVRIISTLLTLVFIVTIPPLLVATLLIATLIILSYTTRRFDGARLRALGATKNQVLYHYLVETISLTLASAVFSYLLSCLATYVIGIYFLELESVVYFDRELVVGLVAIVVLVATLGFYLFKNDTMPLRELLAYESNR